MHPARPPVVVEKAGVGTEMGTTNSSTIASAVGRKIDALFSPVLRLLDTHDEEVDEETGLEKDPQQQATQTTSTTSTASSDSPASTVTSSTQNSTLEMHHHHDTDELSIQGQEMPESDEFNPWQFIQSLPAYAHVQHLRPPITLAPKDPQAPPLTLVLDLDETLVHCSVEPTPDPDLVFPVEFHGTTYQVHVQLRPFLLDFLQALQGKFEIILFTASQKIYANELWNRIDPGTLKLVCCAFVWVGCILLYACWKDLCIVLE
jgi:TFIIF-interacting CTD phosphatase-like protein